MALPALPEDAAPPRGGSEDAAPPRGLFSAVWAARLLLPARLDGFNPLLIAALGRMQPLPHNRLESIVDLCT